MNLDADNVLSRDFAKEVLGVLQAKYGERPKGITGFRCKTGGSDRGVTGRVGLTAGSFLMLGGYNEEFHPTGCQDIDLFERCNVHQAIMFEGSSGWSIPKTHSPQGKVPRHNSKSASATQHSSGMNKITKTGRSQERTSRMGVGGPIMGTLTLRSTGTMR